MSKNKLSMTDVNDLVGIKPVSNETTLDDCYVTTVQLAIAGKTIKSRGDSCFFRLRYEVVQVANEFMTKKGLVDSSDLDWDLVCAVFITRLEATEKRMDSKADKRPPVWTNAKSQLKAGLEEGFDFIDDPGVGQSALRDAVKDIRDAKAEATRQEKIKEEFGEDGLTDASATGSGAPAASGNASGDAGAAAGDTGTGDAGAAAPAGNAGDHAGFSFKDPALTAAFTALLEKAVALEATTGKNRKERTGAMVVMTSVTSMTDTLDISLESFNNAMAKLAEAS